MILPVTILAIAAAVYATEETPVDARTETVTMIDKRLTEIEQSSDTAVSQMRELAKTIMQKHPDNVVVREELTAALEQATGEDKAQKKATLSVAILKAKATLAFKPIREAKLPEGFPEPTPAGEIRVKSHPTYRLARTQTNGGQGGAFNVLFNHIKQNDIAMTAPVEMEYQQTQRNEIESKSMAFLYGSRDLGTLRDGAKVDVVDVPAMTTISLGLRGMSGDKQIVQAKQYLDQWLADHADQYEATGDLRVMGYNSPFVPTAMRYSEVEIPVTKK